MAARAAAPAAGVFLIAGPDSFLAEAALEAVLGQALGTERGDGVQVMRGDETSWARVLDAARTRSLFSPRRAVVVRNAEALKGDDSALAGYLADPNPDVALVFVASKPDRRRGAWRLLSERAEQRSAEALKGRALRAHVEAELRRRKLPLAADALQELLERVGQDLRRLMGELDKLEAFAQGRERISADDVAAVTGQGIARPVYKIADAAWARRAAEVLELIDEVMEDGESALRLLGTLHRSLRQVRAARVLVEQRVPRDQLASRLGVLPFKVGDLLDAARRWSDADLAAAFRTLSEADQRVKQGADPRSTLSAAVAGALRAAPQDAARLPRSPAR